MGAGNKNYETCTDDCWILVTARSRKETQLQYSFRLAAEGGIPLVVVTLSTKSLFIDVVPFGLSTSRNVTFWRGRSARCPPRTLSKMLSLRRTVACVIREK